jgi:hypothetical protein
MSSSVRIKEVRDDKGATGYSTEEAGSRARRADRGVLDQPSTRLVTNAEAPLRAELW